MSTFDDRERAEEARYALDQDTQFRVMNRRNKLLGLWAAGLLGIEGAAADDYAKSVVLSDLEEAGDDDVLRKVLGDLKAGGLSLTESEVRNEMARLMPIAREQILKDIKG